MKPALITSYFLCMASFGWAMRGFFVKSATAPTPEQRCITHLGPILALFQLATLWLLPASASPAAAITLCLLSLSIFWAAIQANRAKPLRFAFDNDNPQHLTATGPYRWVRHPFYLSYMLCWLAPFAATAWWPAILPAAFMLLIYWRASSREESTFLSSPLASHYRQYQQQAGRFWPKWQAAAGDQLHTN